MIPTACTPDISNGPSETIYVPSQGEQNPGQKKRKFASNVVLPDYKETLIKPEPLVERSMFASWSRSFSQLFTTFLPKQTEQVVPNLSLQTISKVVIIGIHGWFPSKIFNRVIGEPTGTSDYIAAKMHKATCDYFQEHFSGSPIPIIDIICLERQGKVEDRVASHYDQLLDPSKDWKQKIKQADFIVFIAHSQGTPVSGILLSKLIKNNHIDPHRQQVGIVAMAGISHGPYPTLKSSVVIKYVEADPAKQLFEFNNPYSAITKKYYESMDHILNCGVRFAAIGSWYDQVVPLYSATIQGLHHPNIFRALYIDHVDYQPDFLSHLVVFALKLRNYGLSDHGLVFHLSEVLMGNIYGFGTQGHSAIYEEDNTYAVGLSWIIGQSNFWKEESKNSVVTHPPLAAATKLNPYYLPWIMARMLFDTEISSRQDLKDDLDMIVSLFLAWSPNSGDMKDLKYKLDPLKSKL
jgi:hypothetical protein